MILTCPECGTSYFVDDARIPPGGRSVKCSSCDARWMAMPEAPSAPAPPPSAPKVAPPPASFGADDPFVGDLEVIAPSEMAFAPTARRAPRAKLPGRVKPEGGGKAVIWIGAALAVAILVAGAIIFRDVVVKTFPDAQAAYAGVGLPVDSLGLAIEAVKAEPIFEGGSPALAVSGAIRNGRGKSAVSPRLRVSLLDRNGRSVAVKIVRPLDGTIPAGATRHFMVTIADPPLSGRDLVVAFESRGAKPAATPVWPEPAKPAPVGPAPAEAAKPLPAGSPDALPKHD